MYIVVSIVVKWYHIINRYLWIITNEIQNVNFCWEGFLIALIIYKRLFNKFNKEWLLFITYIWHYIYNIFRNKRCVFLHLHLIFTNKSVILTEAYYPIYINYFLPFHFFLLEPCKIFYNQFYDNRFDITRNMIFKDKIWPKFFIGDIKSE